MMSSEGMKEMRTAMGLPSIEALDMKQRCLECIRAHAQDLLAKGDLDGTALLIEIMKRINELEG